MTTGLIRFSAVVQRAPHLHALRRRMSRPSFAGRLLMTTLSHPHSGQFIETTPVVPAPLPARPALPFASARTIRTDTARRASRRTTRRGARVGPPGDDARPRLAARQDVPFLPRLVRGPLDLPFLRVARRVR